MNMLTSANTIQITFPKHVAIIMDGNGRWAKQQGKLRIWGHQNGVKAVRKAVNFAIKNNIEVLTLYAFSSENWSRSDAEVSALMTLFIRALDSEVKKLHKHNIRLNILGDISRFSKNLQQKISQAQSLTENNNGMILNVAANYGGMWDITHATQQIAKQVQQGCILPEQIDSTYFERYLSTAEQPPVDLLIRTSGEHRISNFLLWQIAYAELFFTPVLWPDFDEETFQEAIRAYQCRIRRFGGN